jgi:hypothetical protein
MCGSSLQELTQRAKVDIQIFFFQAKLSAESVNFLGLFHQGYPQPFDLFIGEASGFDAPDALALQEFMQELYQGEDQLPQAVLHIFLSEVEAGHLPPGVLIREQAVFLHDLAETV